MIRPVLGACLVMAALATSAQAQDWRGTPVYGTARLSAGFTPDPHTVDLTAGGPIDASRVNASDCVGNIGGNPDYVVNYSADDMPLYIRASSDSDVSLVVRDPRGNWQCNDDTNSFDPEVSYGSPRSGSYAIWVGAVGENTVSARLEISEISGESAGSSDGVDTSAEATFGEVILRSGFTPDPAVVDITAGGTIRASNLDSSCAGVIASAPDYEVTYRDGGNFPLTFTFRAKGDTTLVINAPDGSWYCDDDSGGGNNPRVVFRDAMDGVYDIWVGTFGDDPIPGKLSISEVQ
ncbi:hypothetical protein OB03_05735 [Brevundimonas sp. GN22]